MKINFNWQCSNSLLDSCCQTNRSVHLPNLFQKHLEWYGKCRTVLYKHTSYVFLGVVYSHLHCLSLLRLLAYLFCFSKGSGRIITSILRFWSICKHAMSLGPNSLAPFYSIKWFVWCWIRSIIPIWLYRIVGSKRIGTMVSCTPLWVKSQTSKWNKRLDIVVLLVSNISVKFISNFALS